MNKLTRVILGSRVVVENEEEGKLAFVLVLSNEVNLVERKISVNSPVGRVLMDRKLGEIVVAETPAGSKSLKIISVSV